MNEYPKWLREAAAKGGKKSKRKLTKKEARRIAMVRWAAGAGRGAVKASNEAKTQAQNDQGQESPTKKD